jgi:hypothetical protein
VKATLFGSGLLIAACLALEATSLRAARSEEPVAIVYQVSGTASATANGATKPVLLFTRLPAGALVFTGKDSRVTLAFSNGNRCELGAAARTTLTARDCTSSSGPVRRLSPVPPLPLVARTVPDATNDEGYAAVRVRANEIHGLYPHAGTATLADETVLRFVASDGGEYHAKVADPDGSKILEVSTRSGEVRVPAGILRPATRYSWTVRTLTRSGKPESGSAQFTTVSAESAKRRDALRETLLASNESSALALAASIDEALGLQWEAREELRQAAAKDPGDQSLREALERLSREISDGRP